MVKERPAFCSILALAIGILLYAKWLFLAGFLDLLTVAVITVMVVAAIFCLAVFMGKRSAACLVMILLAGMACGIALAASCDSQSRDGSGRRPYVSQGAALLRGSVMGIFKANGMEGDEFAVVSAMTLGEKGRMDRRLRQEYSQAGVAHVLALSGTHLAILYFILTLLAGGGGAASRFILTGAIWCYVVFVGMPVSAVRAAVMLSMFALSDVLRRGYDRLDVLVFTVFIMLLVEPFVILDVGFQLSVVSVGAIIVVCPLLNGLLPEDFAMSHTWLTKLWNMIAVGIAAQMGSAPLVAYYFGTVSCLSLISNLIVVPLATVILYGAVAVGALFPFPLLQGAAVRAIGGVAWLMNQMLGMISGLPFAYIEGIDMTLMQLLVSYILIAVILRLIKYIQLK